MASSGGGGPRCGGCCCWVGFLVDLGAARPRWVVPGMAELNGAAHASVCGAALCVGGLLPLGGGCQ